MIEKKLHPKPGRPKAINRIHVINVAMNSYWIGGIHNISLNEICRRAKVSKPALYREFGNEDGLMTEALELYFTKFITPFFTLFSSHQSFHEVLQKLILVLINNQDKNSNSMGCLFTMMRDSHDLLGKKTKNKLDLLHNLLLKAYEQWIESAKNKGNFTKQIPSAVAAAYIDCQISNINAQKARGENIQLIRDAACLAFSVLVKKPFHIN